MRVRAASQLFKTGALFLAVASALLVSCSSGMKEGPQLSLRPGTASTPDRVAGEYIVTVLPGGDAVLLRDLYAAYGVREISDLGKGLLLLKVERDPGLAEIKRRGLESGKLKDVQPNFIYRGDGP